ncbi:MAG: glycosyltransferase [Kiloniellales bacterium]
MMQGRKSKRVLIYSHDTFGLGHLRRCREIAHSLVGADRDLSVLILSGSPIIGSFNFRSRVDFVRIPGVIKLRNGEYTSLSLHIDTEHTLAIRASIIEHTAKIFDPHIFLVDKEPLGLRGEVRDTLALMKARGTACVLGLRDVMDDPVLLKSEWRRRNLVPWLVEFYDHIWVYGLREIYDPLAGLEMPETVRRRMTYTGYLPRHVPEAAPLFVPEKISDPFILVTVGGGGDGEEIMDWVLSAYETDKELPYPALLVLGPFMGSQHQAEFLQRANRLANVEAITFDAHMESLMARAMGVVCMGGYNTFCEVLSFDKPALVIPRTAPRKEQLIRATRAEELGLTRMLAGDGRRAPQTMAEALRALPHQAPPSSVVVPGLLDGRANVIKLARQLLEQGGTPFAEAERSLFAVGQGAE